MADQSELDLEAAFERLYEAFARYAAVPMYGCPHCFSEADHARLRGKPLRELQPEDLDQYAFKAISTWGDTENFRYFLPRMLELLVRHGDAEGGWLTTEQVFEKLDYAGWRAWPVRDRDAIAAFFDGLWPHVLEHFPHPFGADACLYGLVQTHDDLGRQLAAWRITQSRPAARHFAQFMADHPIYFSPRYGLRPSGLGGQDRPAVEQLVHWLLDPVRRSEAEEAFFAFCDNEDDAVLLSQALDELAQLQPA